VTNQALIFIHGSGDSRSIWRLQVEHFGAERAFTLDLPGHGQRSNTLPMEVTVQDYTHAAYHIIKDELHFEQPILAGHSLGSAIALTMALQYPTALHGLILIGAGARLRVHPSLLEDAQQNPQYARTRLLELGVTQANAATVGQSILQEQALAGSTEPTVLYRDLAACNVFDSMLRLYEIQIPTLILCGEEDRLTPVKYSQYLHQQIHNSTLHIIPHAGHYVMREQAGQVNQAIEQWLETVR